MKLVMLGTGHATVTKCYNTCFTLRDGENFFLVDAGGGNGILSRMAAAGLQFKNLKGMFVTHAHTDHICGVIWVIRMMQGAIKSGEYTGDFCIYCHDEVKRTLAFMCDNMLANGSFGYAEGRIKLIEVKDGETFSCMGVQFTAFDIFSTKKKQFGFHAEINGGVLACLGDEPYNPKCEEYVSGSGFIMCEAFCMERDADIFKPHKISHGTALESALTAEKLGAKNLLLYHTEDTDLTNRKESYTAEAATAFSGNIFVPDDLDEIKIY